MMIEIRVLKKNKYFWQPKVNIMTNSDYRAENPKLLNSMICAGGDDARSGRVT